ncbi:MAG: hypothetical protein P8Y38_14545 [Deltaproteobacteria bacterium]
MVNHGGHNTGVDKTVLLDVPRLYHQAGLKASILDILHGVAYMSRKPLNKIA